MFTHVFDMTGPTELAVVAAIEKLNATERIFDQKAIAELARCHFVTVSRACRRLVASGQLTITGTPRTGYRYIIHNPCTPTQNM